MTTGDSSAPSTLQVPVWQREYEAVLSERDPIALFKRIEVAEPAILSRREHLQKIRDHSDERKRLEEALSKLLMIKKDWIKFM